MGFAGKLEHAALMTAGMAWQTAWTLVLGFTISAVLQTIVSTEALKSKLGRDGAKEVALASIAGAGSSSCSYASAAIMRTLFKKGAALTPSLAFLFASTNLVLELGVILFLLLGWQFMASEWIGGVVLIVILTLLVKLTYPRRLAEQAREHRETGHAHDHGAMQPAGDTWRDRLANPEAPGAIARSFAMEFAMLWKDLLIGFVVGGSVSAFVPPSFWHTLFLNDAPRWVQVPGNTLIGPVVAMLTFVCSIGNVPLAAVLWAGGAGFGGVIAFLYADLIVLPLLDTYRRFFGWKFAAYLGAVFFVTMAVAAMAIDIAFSALGWVPARTGDATAHITHFAINYTFWLNLGFGALAIFWFWKARQGGDDPHHHTHAHQR